MLYFWRMNADVKSVFLNTVFIFLLFPFLANAQTKIIKGVIKDAHSDERIPFASISFKKSGSGKLSDSAGNFIFRLDNGLQIQLKLLMSATRISFFPWIQLYTKRKVMYLTFQSFWKEGNMLLK